MSRRTDKIEPTHWVTEWGKWGGKSGTELSRALQASVSQPVKDTWHCITCLHYVSCSVQSTHSFVRGVSVSEQYGGVGGSWSERGGSWEEYEDEEAAGGRGGGAGRACPGLWPQTVPRPGLCLLPGQAAPPPVLPSLWSPPLPHLPVTSGLTTRDGMSGFGLQQLTLLLQVTFTGQDHLTRGHNYQVRN